MSAMAFSIVALFGLLILAPVLGAFLLRLTKHRPSSCSVVVEFHSRPATEMETRRSESDAA
jgi:hypothetical protein